MTPKGFFSYARGDDAGMDSEITALRHQIANEISTLFGRDIDMFQDVYDIRTGDDWEERLRGELTEASFMIPVLTPRYFERPWCREEVMTYLRLAEEAGRPALIFPFYLVRDRKFDRGEHCEVRAALARTQHFDFRGFRFEEIPILRNKAIHDFAEDVVDRMEEQLLASSDVSGTPPAEPEPMGGSHGSDTALAANSALETQTDAASERTWTTYAEETVDSFARTLGWGTDDAPAQMPPPSDALPSPAQASGPTFLSVHPNPGEGDFNSIQAAIDAAAPGAEIEIAPGLYQEALRLDKPLSLRGTGPISDVVIQPRQGNPIRFLTDEATLCLLTLRVPKTGTKSNALSITGPGKLLISTCRITSETFTGTYVSGAGTTPTFEDCFFLHGFDNGVYVDDHARPVFRGCMFADNARHGVAIVNGADPMFVGCDFNHNGANGAFAFDAGRGDFSECWFRSNAEHGCASQSDGMPRLKLSKFEENGRWGFRTNGPDSGAHLEDCRFVDNRLGAYFIARGSQDKVTVLNPQEE